MDADTTTCTPRGVTNVCMHVHTSRIHGMFFIYTWISYIHMYIYLNHAPYVHDKYTPYRSSMHRLYMNGTSIIHQSYIICISSVHRMYTTNIQRVHHLHTTHTSFAHYTYITCTLHIHRLYTTHTSLVFTV